MPKLALLTAGLGLAAAPTAALAATHKPKPTVTVRIEGSTRTLLPATQVAIPIRGQIIKGGTPKGACSADTAAGALDRATHHRWTATYFSSVPGIFINSIFGVAPKGNDYWNLFVNNHSSMVGICAVRLHRGEQLLLAVGNGSQAPLVLRAPARATVGTTITATVGSLGPHGFKPAAGVTVSAPGLKLVSDRRGRVRISIAHAGTLVLRAAGKRYVRAAPVRIREVA